MYIYMPPTKHKKKKIKVHPADEMNNFLRKIIHHLNRWRFFLIFKTFGGKKRIAKITYDKFTNTFAPLIINRAKKLDSSP